MRLETLRLENFRNYQTAAAEFAPDINVIAGENAQGKTNLLEAVWLLTGSRSFRARQERELVRFGADFSRLEAQVFAWNRPQRIELLLCPGKRRQLLRNGVRERPSAPEIGLTAVRFCPEDLSLLKGAAALRRQFLDSVICQLRPSMGRCYAEFHKLHEGKTRILRDFREKPSLLETLEEYSEAMARASAMIIRCRASCAQRLAELAAPIHRDFSGGRETLTLAYQTISTVENALDTASNIYEAVMEHQRAHRQAELDSGLCLTGAHRDDFSVCINDQSARSFASQGQTRTAVLSLKLAERELHRQKTGQWPLLLLDDVLSELDARRQSYVLDHTAGGQTLLTCCAGEEKLGGKVIRVEGGALRG